MRPIVGNRNACWGTVSLEQTDSFNPIEVAAKTVTNVFLFGASLSTLLGPYHEVRVITPLSEERGLEGSIGKAWEGGPRYA